MRTLLALFFIGLASAQTANVFVLTGPETKRAKAAYESVTEAQKVLDDAKDHFAKVKGEIVASHGLKNTNGDFNPDFTAFQGWINTGVLYLPGYSYSCGDFYHLIVC